MRPALDLIYTSARAHLDTFHLPKTLAISTFSFIEHLEQQPILLVTVTVSLPLITRSGREILLMLMKLNKSEERGKI